MAHETCLLRTGEKPLADATRLPVNACADEVKNFRDVLNLVQNGRKPHAVEEPLRVVPEAGHHVRVLEQVIARFGKQVAQQNGLAGAARAGQHDGGKAPGRLEGLGFHFAAEVTHRLSFLRCWFKKLKPIPKRSHTPTDDPSVHAIVDKRNLK